MSLLDDWSEDLNVKTTKKASTDRSNQSSISNSILDEWQFELDNPAPQKESFYDSQETRLQRGIRDVLEQTGVGLASGLGGAYGNILSLAGINPEEGYINPGEKAKYDVESQILEKMQQPGYKPSLSELYALSDDDISPQYSRLPTTPEIARKIEDVGGPGEALTPEGGIARRASEIFGGGLSLGATGVIPALAGGAAGEAAKFLGLGPVGQAIFEIVTMILSKGKGVTQNPLTSKDPAILNRIKDLRKSGFNDKEIVLAVNAQKAALKKATGARATAASERNFSEALGKSEGLFSEVIESAFPGFEHGPEYLHEVASDAYGKVARGARGIKIPYSPRFERTIDNVTKQVRKTLGENPEARPFLDRLEKASEAAQLERSAEEYINFYKELNKMGKWANPSDRERLISHVKNGIKSTFRNAGPEGRVLAQEFEEVNRGIQKAYQAEAVKDIISKNITPEGIDWKKMQKMFYNKKSRETLRRGLGEEQTRNLYRIAEAAKDIKSLEKALGSKISPKKLEELGGSLTGIGVIWSLLEHTPKYAIGSVALKLGAKGINNARSRLQTQLLTNPKLQNLSLKAMEAVKKGSPQLIQKTSADIEKYLEEEGIIIQ